IYPALVLHGIQTFSSGDVMRFLGRKVHGNFEGEITSDFKDRSEGIRIKHCVKTNSIQAYNKGGNGLRIETTMNDPGDFKVFRPKQGQPDGKLQWLCASALPTSIGALRSAKLPTTAIWTLSRVWLPP